MTDPSQPVPKRRGKPPLLWPTKTHCPHGHDLSVVGMSISVRKTGPRAGDTRYACRQCQKDVNARSQALAASRRSDPLEMINEVERARFWAKVDKTETCWIWTGRFQNAGYGATEIGGRIRLAHRVAYFAVRGPIPSGLELDHLCEVTACVNPHHLDPVTHAENISRADTRTDEEKLAHPKPPHPSRVAFAARMNERPTR